jgi:GH25 family lysozyme M1 (1,4-beta-N-acetylmuramidase)
MKPLVVDMFSGEVMESAPGGPRSTPPNGQRTGGAEDFHTLFAALQAGDPSRKPGLIHKATQGTRLLDKECMKRIPLAREAGFLVGVYHFGTSAPVLDQVVHFLEAFEALGSPDDMLLALDFEKNELSPADSMSYVQARQFLKLVFDRTGHRCVLYSGAKIKEALPRGGDPFISQHKLWMPQYGARATLPPGFTRFFLWQYTGDGVGPMPHDMPGVRTRGIDLNVYSGSDLAAEWSTFARQMPAHAGAVAGAAAASESADERLDEHLVIRGADLPADEEPIPFTPADLKQQGSGTMSAIDRLLIALGLPTLGAMGVSIADFFGYFKEALGVVKDLARDNPRAVVGMVLVLGCVAIGLVLRARWRLLLAAREGRYQPQQPGR